MLSTVLVKLLNIGISLNPAVDLQPLAGHSLGLCIDELPQDIAISVENGEFVVAEIETATVTLSGDIRAFLTMMQDKDGLDSSDLFINGHIGVARRYQSVLSSLSIDWEGFFERFLPPEWAQRSADAVEQSLAFAKQSKAKLSEGLRDYIVNDKQLLVSRAEFELLQRQTQQINDRLDSLLATFDKPKALS